MPSRTAPARQTRSKTSPATDATVAQRTVKPAPKAQRPAKAAPKVAAKSAAKSDTKTAVKLAAKSAPKSAAKAAAQPARTPAKKPKGKPAPLVLESAVALTGVELARRATGAKAKNLLPFDLTLVEVRESGIHGLGVFAAKRIAKGTHIGDILGRRTMRNNDHVLWIEGDDGKTFGLEPWNELRFTNHSDKPNAVFYGAELHALRAIAKGEEITFDYNGDVDPDAR